MVVCGLILACGHGVVVVVVVTIVGYDLWGCGCVWQWWCGFVVCSQTGRGREREEE